MKKHIMISAVLLGSLAYGQVGINTEEPKATLDVVASPTDDSKIDGIIAPRLEGNELKAKDALYTTDQTGAIVYATSAASPATAKTANITEEGYYYFDGSVWVKLNSGAATTEPWYMQNTATQAQNNTDDIYQQGKVAVGFTSADAVSEKQFEVKGDLKAEYSNGSNLFGGIATNADGTAGVIGNGFYMRNTENPTDATLLSSIQTSTPGSSTMNSVSKFTDNTSSNSQVMTYSFPGLGSLATMAATNEQANTSSKIELNGMGTGTGLVRIEDNTLDNTFSTKVGLHRENGIDFRFAGADGSYEGSYRFPRTAPAANQVLARVGSAPGGTPQLGWQDISALATEPWNVEGSLNSATQNTQNIYQNGRVGIMTGTRTLPDLLTVRAVDDPNMGITIETANHETSIFRFTGLANGGQGNIDWYKSDHSTLAASVRTTGNNSNAAKALAFYTNNGAAAAERVRITESGDVGIGTANPDEKLEVNGAVKVSTAYSSSSISNGATAPVPSGGAGTIVFQNNHFFGWNGTEWKQLDN